MGRRSDERLAPGDVDDQVADAQVFGLGPLRHSAAVFSGSGYIRARPWMIDVADTSDRPRAADPRRRRPTGRGSTAARAAGSPSRADLLAADVRGPSRRRPSAMSPSTNVAGRDDLELVGRAPVLGQPRLDVDVELLGASASVEWRLKIASDVAAASSRPPSLSPAWRMTGWPCGLRGTVKWPWMSNCCRGARTPPAAPGRTNCPAPSATISSSAHESHSSARRVDELAGPHVAVGVVEEAAAAEVLAGERVRRRDDVPAPPGRPTGGRAWPAGGPARRLVERGVQRAGQPEVRR